MSNQVALWRNQPADRLATREHLSRLMHTASIVAAEHMTPSWPLVAPTPRLRAYEPGSVLVALTLLLWKLS